MQKERTVQLSLPLAPVDQVPPLPKEVRAEIRHLLVLMLLQAARSPVRQEGPENERDEPPHAPRA